MPDWRVVYKNPELRKLWWRGIPTKLRATLWEKAAGNPLALSKGTSSKDFHIAKTEETFRALSYLFI